MPLQNKYDLQADPVLYRGCFFHSLLELKFVLSIEKEYRFLREPVKIGYDPKTMQTTSYFREHIKVYTPDFLIRNKRGGMACLIEVKPAFLKGSPEIDMYERLLKDYIDRKKLDWDFAVLFGDEIPLTKDQQNRFDLLRNHKNKFSRVINLHKMDRKYNGSGMIYSSAVPMHPGDVLNKNEYSNFVKFGKYKLV